MQGAMKQLRAKLVAAATAVLATAGPALADLPDMPGKLSSETPWTSYVLGIGLAVGVCVGAFKSGKRSHLD